MESLVKSAASAVLSYTAHYATTKFYNYLCVPDGMIGFLTGLVTTGSPVCQASLKVISNTEMSYSTIIIMGVTRGLIDTLLPKAWS